MIAGEGQAVLEDVVQETGTTPMILIPDATDGIDMERLVGKRQVFARVRRLRDGLLMEPIAMLTLEPGGRISGHVHSNEGSWIRYGYGQVSEDRAFAFVTAHNNWIPSSTWTQSLGDMPTGFFCDEPEVGESAQQMCLIPDEPLPADTVVVYVVASCLRFYERTIPKMLGQLLGEGIRPEQIKVVVNGCAENSDRIVDGVEYAFSTHDAWEWTALYEAPLRWRFDYGFLIHDTTVVMPGFRRSVEGVNGHVRWDHMPASPMARCLLGMYSHEFLMRCNDWLAGLDHITKKDGVITEAGGELLLRARSVYVIGDPDANGEARSAEWGDTVDQFNTGSPRVRRVFPAVKLHKFIHTGPTNPTAL